MPPKNHSVNTAVPAASARARRKQARQSGSALVEFVVAASFLILPLLLGTIVFGFSIVRANQVTEVCRDAAHMYAGGVDFSSVSGQNVLLRLADGLNMTANGGNGVIILSTIAYVTNADCQAANLSNCANANSSTSSVVFTNRVVVGNASLHPSGFGGAGSPAAGIIGAQGMISPQNYLTNGTALATNFSNVITLVDGQKAYVAEMFVSSPDLNLWTAVGSGIISARSIF